MEYYRESYDICGRKKYIISKSFLNFSNIDLKIFTYPKNDESLSKEYDVIKEIEKNRKLQKISLSNPELFFNSLIKSYFEAIGKADESRKKSIGNITRILKDLILDYLNLIQNNQKFSEKDIKILNILFYSPIIGTEENSNIKRLLYNAKDENNNEKNDDNTNYIFVSNNKLIFNHVYTRVSDNKIVQNKKEYENAEVYNIKLIKKEIVDEIEINNITKIKLLKYVKIKYFQENNFYTHNKDYWKFNKDLLRYILRSKTIKTLFQRLYPNNIFIFEKEENINLLINSIIFIPYELYDSYGCTFKKELIIFIEGLFERFSKPIHYLSKSSSFMILGIHEGCGHWASGLYSILCQDISLSNSTILSQEIIEEIKLEENNENISSKKRENDDSSEIDGGDLI